MNPSTVILYTKTDLQLVVFKTSLERHFSNLRTYIFQRLNQIHAWYLSCSNAARNYMKYTFILWSSDKIHLISSWFCCHVALGKPSPHRCKTKGYVTPEKSGPFYNGRSPISAFENRWQHHPSPPPLLWYVLDRGGKISIETTPMMNCWRPTTGLSKSWS